MWNDEFVSMCNNTPITSTIYDNQHDPDRSNWDSPYTSENNMELLLSTSNTLNRIDDDETEEKEELDHQRLVFDKKTIATVT